MEIWSDDLEESETTTPTFCFLSHSVGLGESGEKYTEKCWGNHVDDDI